MKQEATKESQTNGPAKPKTARKKFVAEIVLPFNIEILILFREGNMSSSLLVVLIMYSMGNKLEHCITDIHLSCIYIHLSRFIEIIFLQN